LINDQDLNRIKDRLQEDCDALYEESIRKHHNLENTNAPFWLYIALAWFAFDDIVGWFLSPILFYPIMLIGGAICVIFSTGTAPFVMPVVKEFVNKGLR
jgi:hypothetical protein